MAQIDDMQDRPVLGIALMLCFCIAAPLQDTMAKIMAGLLPIATLVFIRFAFQALFLVPICWATGRPIALRGRRLVLAWIRVGLHVTGIAAMFSALIYLPLADAVAIAFVMPFIMLLLGWWFLNEEVCMRRLAACAVGFCGTLMVVQPAFERVGWPALLPVIVAFAFAFYMLVTRRLSKEADPMGLQALNGVMATAVLGPVLCAAWFFGIPVWSDAGLEAWSYVMLLGIGLLGTFAHLLMTWSLRFAPSATLAPMQYLEIPVATFLGWLVFADLPNSLAALGIAVTMGAGLYIIWREHAMAAPRAAPGQPH